MTLASLLLKAYPSPEWAVFFEVGNGTGWRARRHADAVAIGIWPSRGHTIIGFEFKTDRRDWLREMKDPAKAEEVAAHCDGWYLVTHRKEVAAVDELPEPWGLYVANDDQTKLRCVKPCVPYARDKSTMSRSFAAAILRKVPETTVPKSELERLVDERATLRSESSHDGWQLKHAQAELARLVGVLDAFKAKTGVDLRNGWQGPENISAAVNAVLSVENYRQSLERASKTLTASAKSIDDALAAWPEQVCQERRR